MPGSDNRKGTSDKGRTVITTKGEEPKSARASKEFYQLWKFLETLNSEEIQVILTIRRNKIKHSNDFEEIRDLRTEILIIEDAYRIIKRREKNGIYDRSNAS